MVQPSPARNSGRSGSARSSVQREPAPKSAAWRYPRITSSSNAVSRPGRSLSSWAGSAMDAVSVAAIAPTVALLGPAEPGARERQLAHALGGGGEDGVAERRDRRRQ